jgi:outer membrane protein assembly factor BamE (lipoprotein component of BamABCDE complex)
MSTADGQYQQLEGRPIDYEAVDRLIEKQSTKEEVVAALGLPTRTAMLEGRETLTYESTKQRESVSRVAGIRVSESRQTMEEQVTLTFENGTLVHKEKKHTIR